MALLPSLAEALGITVTELLKGEAVDTERQMPLQEVEHLVTGTLAIQAEQPKDANRGPWLRRWLICLVLEAALLLLGKTITHQTFLQILGNPNSCTLIISMLLGTVFGLCGCFLPARLPSYYDENKIYGYYGRGFRMQLPIALNNRNWNAIRRAMLCSCFVMMTAMQVLWFAVEALLPYPCAIAKQVGGTFLVLLIFFVPMLVAGIRADRRQNK